MDGRLSARAAPQTLRGHLEAHAWLYRAGAGACLWITTLYIAGPHLGVLFICGSALLFFFCAHRLGGRSKGAGGYAFLNAHGQGAAGEMSSRELDAQLRGLPPPQAEAQASGSGGWQGAEAGSSSGGGSGGKALGSGAVPSKNALLAELAEQRARRRAAAAAGAGAQDAAAPP